METITSIPAGNYLFLNVNQYNIGKLFILLFFFYFYSLFPTRIPSSKFLRVFDPKPFLY